MPIISASPVEKRIFRITLTYGQGIIENMIINDSGEYQIYYIKDCKSQNKTGKIVNIVYNKNYVQNSYILFDYECDVCSHKHIRDKIFFHEIVFIKDVTPTDAYMIAVQRGFKGSVDEWLESMRGPRGKDAYEISCDLGFKGSREEWLKTLRGPRGCAGKDAYELAVEYGGYKGTREEYASLYKTMEDAVVYINGYKEIVESLKKDNSDNKQAIAEMGQEISSLERSTEEIRELADSTGKKLEEFRTDTESNFRHVDESINNISTVTEKKIESVSQAVQNIDQKISDTTQDLTAIEDRVEEVSNNISTVAENVQEIATKLTWKETM